MKSKVLNMKCIRELEGFTLNKVYKLLGCAGEYVCLCADNGIKYIVNESYFEIIK